MHHMILIYSSTASEAALRADAHDAFRAAHDSLISELSASGELLATRELVVDGAKIVRTGDESSIVDGPYAGASEWLSGYYLVDVADEGRTLALAARLVESRLATVEVRRLR